jgi:hypothetical protein
MIWHQFIKTKWSVLPSILRSVAFNPSVCWVLPPLFFYKRNTFVQSTKIDDQDIFHWCDKFYVFYPYSITLYSGQDEVSHKKKTTISITYLAVVKTTVSITYPAVVKTTVSITYLAVVKTTVSITYPAVVKTTVSITYPAVVKTTVSITYPAVVVPIINSKLMRLVKRDSYCNFDYFPVIFFPEKTSKR